MSDVPTATKIAALEEQVRQLTASVTRECDRRIEETERLRCELDGQEATRKFRAAELHAVRMALDERREYAERLLAENVRLTNDAAFMRSFINNEDVRSDFQTVTAMRETLDSLRNSIYAACAGSGCLNAHELRVALDAARNELEQYRMRLAGALIASEGGDGQPSDALEYLRTCPTITSVMKLRQALDRERERSEGLDNDRAHVTLRFNEEALAHFNTLKELERERERCGVLEREVKAWHAAEHLRKDEWHAEFGELVEARWNTARTHALDAAKFVGGGQ